MANKMFKVYVEVESGDIEVRNIIAPAKRSITKMYEGSKESVIKMTDITADAVVKADDIIETLGNTITPLQAEYLRNVLGQ